MSFVEVDQSGRIEMSGSTVVAIANSFSVTVEITAEVKKNVQTTLQQLGVKSNMIMIRMFVAAVLLGIKQHVSKITYLTLDEEYTGYDAIIASFMLDRIRRMGYEFDRSDLHIANIGKESPAHRAAIRVMRRQARPDIVATVDDMLRFCQ
jgi:hypothetical protein